MIVLSSFDTPTVVALIVAVVLPALSSLLAKAHWPGAAVGALTLLLSSADGFFSQWASNGSAFQWRAAVVTTMVAYGIALGVRFGILKDTLADAKLRNFGSGPAKTDDTDDADMGSGELLPVDSDNTASIEPQDPDQPAAGVPPPHVAEHAAPGA